MDEFLMKDIFPLIEEGIKNGGCFRFYPKGISMLPLIRQGKDSVVFSKVADVKKYDILLYRRDDGNFVLHRMVGKNDDGYIMCGDGQFWYERGIKEEQLLAKVVGLYRENKFVPLDNPEYIKYVKKRVAYISRQRIKNKIKSILKRKD